MKREFYINIFILILINVIIKPLYLFGIEAEVQNVVGINTWGIYFDLFNLSYLFQIVHEPGIHSYNARNIAREPDRLGYHLPRLLGLKVLLFVVFVTMASMVFYVLGYDETLYRLLLLICVSQFLSTGYMYLRSNISAIGKYRIDSFLSALDKVLMIIIIGVMIYVPDMRASFDILWLAYAQIASYAIAILVALAVLNKHIGQISVTFSWKYVSTMLQETLPFALILLFMSIYTRIDAVMLGRMLGDDNYQAGIYGACYRILDALNMVGYLLAALLLPMFSSLKEVGKELIQLFEVGLRFVIVLCVSLGATVIGYRKEILDYLYDDYTNTHQEVMIPLVLGYIMISIAYIYGTFLVSRNDIRRLNYVYILGIFINIGINIYTIPRYGAVGAAWATFFTELAMLVGQVSLIGKYKVSTISLGAIARIFLFVGGVVIATYLIYAYIPLPWALGFVINGLLAVSIAFVTDMIQWTDVRDIRK